MRSYGIDRLFLRGIFGRVLRVGAIQMKWGVSKNRKTKKIFSTLEEAMLYIEQYGGELEVIDEEELSSDYFERVMDKFIETLEERE